MFSKSIISVITTFTVLSTGVSLINIYELYDTAKYIKKYAPPMMNHGQTISSRTQKTKNE